MGKYSDCWTYPMEVIDELLDKKVDIENGAAELGIDSASIVDVSNKFKYKFADGYSLVRAYHNKTTNRIYGTLYVSNATAFSKEDVAFEIDSGYRPKETIGFPCVFIATSGENDNFISFYYAGFNSNGNVTGDLTANKIIKSMIVWFDYSL